MGLITSKAQEVVSIVLSALGVWILFADRPERLRLISDAAPPPDTMTDPMPMAWDGDLSEEDLSLRMKELRDWIERDRLLDSEPLIPQNRDALVKAQHEHRWEALQATHTTHRKRTVVFGLPKRWSMIPLEKLERISLSDMLVRRHHAGRFLLCRTIAPCVRDIDIQLVVEDPQGDVYTIILSNFPTIMGESVAYLDMLFPVRLVIAIREPTVARGPLRNHLHPFVLVDSPTDVAFPHPNSDLVTNTHWATDLNADESPDPPPLIETYRSLGNQHFKTSHLLPAAFAYTRGLDLDETAHFLRLNRAECYLRLGYFSAALADVEHVLALPDLLPAARIKALYRAGKAHYGRRDYPSAVERFKEFSLLSPGNAEATAGMSRASARLRESASGRYEWTRLFKESQQHPRIDVADFVGPIRVEAIQTRGGGRGIVAVKPIHLGDILAVAKPIASVYPDDLSPNEELRAFDLRTEKLHTKCQTALVSRVIEKIYGNPGLHDDVMSLYSGPYTKPLPSTPKKDVEHLNPLCPTMGIDVGQIEAICTYNNFMPNSLDVGPHNTSIENPAALYILPSFFNHACASNAAWHCVGDAMVIRAVEDIAVGEEITIPYACSESYQERRTALAVYLPNGCDCQLCEEDRKDGDEALDRRERLVSEFERIREGLRPMDALGAACTFVDNLMSTFSSERKGVRPRMISAHHSVAVALQEVAYDADKETWSTYFKDAISEDFKALESAGMAVTDKSMWGPVSKRTMPIATTSLPSFIPHENFVAIMLSIAYSFNVIKDRRRVVRWIKAGAWVEQVAISADKEVFLLRHGATLEHHGLHSIAVEAL